MANNTLTDTTDLDDIVNSVIAMVEPLVTGKVVEMEADAKFALSGKLHKFCEMSNKIRQAHDEWIKLEQDVEPNTALQTIRKQKGSDKKQTGGFLNL